jgi:hypothetical protein
MLLLTLYSEKVEIVSGSMRISNEIGVRSSKFRFSAPRRPAGEFKRVVVVVSSTFCVDAEQLDKVRDRSKSRRTSCMVLLPKSRHILSYAYALQQNILWFDLYFSNTTTNGICGCCVRNVDAAVFCIM